MKVLLVGAAQDYSLEASYRRAFSEQGHQVVHFDIYATLNNYIKLGRFGILFNRFVPVDSWVRKANRLLSLKIGSEKPDLVLVFCNAPVLFSTLAFVKSLLSTRFVLVWPDPLTNLQGHVKDAAPLYDGVATYSNSTIKVFEKLGFTNVHWIPLAADLSLHGKSEPAQKWKLDLVFIGAFRPERERNLSSIIRHFPNLKLEVWGTDWKRSTDSKLKSKVCNKPMFGKAYADIMNTSQICLNIIDETCFPAANMRYFEIPATYSLQLSSSCPEMEHEFINGVHLFQFDKEETLLSMIESILTKPGDSKDIRQNGYEFIINKHTYHKRAQKMEALFL